MKLIVILFLMAVLALAANTQENRSSLNGVVPAYWQERRSGEGQPSSGNKNYLAAKCADLTAIIALSPALENSTITSHGNFVLAKVNNPQGPMLDLGNCRIDGDGQEQEYFHLILTTSETSTVSGLDGKVLIERCAVFISWDEKQWYRPLRNASTVAWGGVTGRDYFGDAVSAHSQIPSESWVLRNSSIDEASIFEYWPYMTRLERARSIGALLIILFLWGALLIPRCGR